jgi:hypothetical protein
MSIVATFITAPIVPDGSALLSSAQMMDLYQLQV